MQLQKYIDLCIIDEYAEKDLKMGYSLDVDSLPEHTKSNFLDELMSNDTTVRDLVLHHMQEMINKRLEKLEERERQDQWESYQSIKKGGQHDFA
jgi:hypothetical protein